MSSLVSHGRHQWAVENFANQLEERQIRRPYFYLQLAILQLMALCYSEQG